MEKKIVPTNGRFSEYVVTYQIPNMWGSLDERKMSKKKKGDHFSIILHLLEKFGNLDDKIVYKILLQRIRSGFRRQYIFQQNGKFYLSPEGEELEKILRSLGRFVLRRYQFEELNFHDKILYLLLFSETIEQYDLCSYFFELRHDSNRFMLIFFLDQSDLSLFLTSDNPVNKAIAEFVVKNSMITKKIELKITKRLLPLFEMCRRVKDKLRFHR